MRTLMMLQWHLEVEGMEIQDCQDDLTDYRKMLPNMRIPHARDYHQLAQLIDRFQGY